MNDAIREAGEHQAAEAEARQAAEDAARAKDEATRMAAQHSIDLLKQGPEHPRGLAEGQRRQRGRVLPQTKVARGRSAPGVLPALVGTPMPLVYPKQPGWFLTTSSDWDAALELLGESDQRVAVLANGKTSRTLRLSDPERRQRLAREIIGCCARHNLTWPDDGPDLTEILVEDTEEQDV